MKLAKYFSVFSQILCDERPNVIILLADDFGLGEFRVNQANSKVPTPNIDRLANEGVNFKDAHAGSSRCGPSRYMLMTGRYAMTPGKVTRGIEADREPHLGKMFSKAGYKTGIFGKSQPLMTQLVHTDATPEETQEQYRKRKEWRLRNFSDPELMGLGGRHPGDEINLFWDVGNYTIKNNEVTAHNFDYSFVTGNPCCWPNGYFENGIQTSEFSKWGIQRIYPENFSNPLNKLYPGSYVAGPWFEEETFGQVLMDNFPASMVSQADYDSRNLDDVVGGKLFDFIREQEDSEQPFYAYWGMRVGHRPFNSPERYRNTTEAGILGEHIAEADDIVGKIFQTLEETGKKDNTLIILMSDNGADWSNDFNRITYGHHQNAVDLNGEQKILRGKKNFPYEGGHRLPFMWWYPKQFQPKTVEDKVVSYVDVYRTLSDIIGHEAQCNEAPDSRSILPFLKSESDEIEGPQWILTHSPKGGTAAFRLGRWKLIAEVNEFYDLRTDPEEKNNLFESEDPFVQDKIAEFQVWLGQILTRIEEREERQNFGEKNIC